MLKNMSQPPLKFELQGSNASIKWVNKVDGLSSLQLYLKITAKVVLSRDPGYDRKDVFSVDFQSKAVSVGQEGIFEAKMPPNIGGVLQYTFTIDSQHTDLFSSTESSNMLKLNGSLVYDSISGGGNTIRLVELRINISGLEQIEKESSSDCWRMYRNGCQSWDTTGSISPVDHEQRYSIMSRLGLAAHYLDVDSPLWGQETGVVSASFMALQWQSNKVESDQTLLVGATTSELGNTEILVCGSHGQTGTSGQITNWESVTDYDGILVPHLSSSEVSDEESSVVDLPDKETVSDLEGQNAVKDTAVTLSLGNNHEDTPSTMGGQDSEQLVRDEEPPLTNKDESENLSMSHNGVLGVAEQSLTARQQNNKDERDSLQLESIVFITTPDINSALEAYGDQVKKMLTLDSSVKRSPLVLAGRAPSGWCSWYHFGPRVSERKMESVINELGTKPALNSSVQYVQLDDGYQMEIGDWTAPNKKFRSGLRALCDKIKQQGFVPGIWLAPFIASRRSVVYREHPDWFLRAKKGDSRPLLAVCNPAWGVDCAGVVNTHPLDLSHTAVLDHIEGFCRELKNIGFELFKVDFLQPGMRRGYRVQGMTRVQAYREGLRSIRRGIGSESFLIGCGAPLCPSVLTMDGAPVFDAMRISRDTESRWGVNAVMNWAAFDAPIPSMENALLGTLSRSWMQQRLWDFIDPDVMILRPSCISLQQLQSQVTVIGMTAGITTFTDNMKKLHFDRTTIGLSVMPSTTVPTNVLGMMQGKPQGLFTLQQGGGNDTSLLALFNWGREQRTVNLWATMFSGSSTRTGSLVPNESLLFVFDFWRGRLVYVIESNPISMSSTGMRISDCSSVRTHKVYLPVIDSEDPCETETSETVVLQKNETLCLQIVQVPIVERVQNHPWMKVVGCTLHISSLVEKMVGCERTGTGKWVIKSQAWTARRSGVVWLSTVPLGKSTTLRIGEKSANITSAVLLEPRQVRDCAVSVVFVVIDLSARSQSPWSFQLLRSS